MVTHLLLQYLFLYFCSGFSANKFPSQIWIEKYEWRKNICKGLLNIKLSPLESFWAAGQWMFRQQLCRPILILYAFTTVRDRTLDLLHSHFYVCWTEESWDFLQIWPLMDPKILASMNSTSILLLKLQSHTNSIKQQLQPHAEMQQLSCNKAFIVAFFRMSKDKSIPDQESIAKNAPNSYIKQISTHLFHH